MAVEDNITDHAFTVTSAETLPDSDDVPRSLTEAKRSPLWDYWKLAMEEEMAQLFGMKTWEVVELPEGRKAIGCKLGLFEET
jgi:hypothetical protein